MVSIVITFWRNPFEEVCRAIESSITESDDVIVVNGGSEIVYPEFKYPITYVDLKSNSFAPTQRNTGYKLAKYDKVICLDGDDTLVPGSLKIMEEQMGTADVVYANMFEDSVRVKPTDFVDFEKFVKGNQIYNTSLVKKSAWERVNGYLELDYLYPEDWLYWVRIARTGGIFKYIDVDIYNHFINPEGGWARGKKTNWLPLINELKDK